MVHYHVLAVWSGRFVILYMSEFFFSFKNIILYDTVNKCHLTEGALFSRCGTCPQKCLCMALEMAALEE